MIPDKPGWWTYCKSIRYLSTPSGIHTTSGLTVWHVDFSHSQPQLSGKLMKDNTEEYWVLSRYLGKAVSLEYVRKKHPGLLHTYVNLLTNKFDSWIFQPEEPQVSSFLIFGKE